MTGVATPSATSRGRARPTTPATEPSLPEDDTDFLFAAHPGGSIDASYVISRAIQLVRERPREVIGVAATSVLLSWALLFGLISLGVLHNALWEAAGIEEVMHPVGVMVLLVIGWAAALLLQAPLVGSAIEIHTERRGLFAELLSRGMARLPQLMAASAIVMVMAIVVASVGLGLAAVVVTIASKIPWGVVQVMVGAIGSLIVAAYALRTVAGFSLLVPVMLVERLEIGEAVGRAWMLGWRHGFAILSALLLPALLVQGIMYPTQFMPPWVGPSVGIVLGVGLVLYQTAVAPVTYVAIREYVEGLHPGRVMDASAPKGAMRAPTSPAARSSTQPARTGKPGRATAKPSRTSRSGVGRGAGDPGRGGKPARPRR